MSVVDSSDHRILSEFNSSYRDKIPNSNRFSTLKDLFSLLFQVFYASFGGAGNKIIRPHVFCIRVLIIKAFSQKIRSQITEGWLSG